MYLQHRKHAINFLFYFLSLLRRILPRTSRKSSTKSTTPPGIASSAGTLAHMSRTKRATLSTSIWDRSPSFYLRAVKLPAALAAKPATEQQSKSSSERACCVGCILNDGEEEQKQQHSRKHILFTITSTINKLQL